MRVTTADRLRQIMDERRLRQVDILRLCEPICAKFNLTLSKSDLSQFVHGKVTPGQWKISILARALNVSEAWLMGYDVSRERPPEFTADEVRNIINQHDDAFHSPISKMAEDVLTHEEQHLLASFRNLNADGQSRVLSFIDFCANDLTLLANPSPPLPSASVF
jgi:transcriptional regulator with XRE-family HTH domain